MKQRKKGRQRNTRKKGREKKIFHIKSASSHIGAKRTRKKRNGITYHYSTKQMQLIFLMPYPSDMTPVFFSLIVYELTCIHRKELIGLSTVWYFPSLRVAVIQSQETSLNCSLTHSCKGEIMNSWLFQKKCYNEHNSLDRNENMHIRTNYMKAQTDKISKIQISSMWKR